MYSNVFHNLRIEFGTAEGRRLKPGRVTGVSKAKLVVLHGSGTHHFSKVVLLLCSSRISFYELNSALQ